MEVSPDGKLPVPIWREDHRSSDSGLQSARSHRSGKTRSSRDGERAFRTVRNFGGDLDLINAPGEHTAMFISADPVVHKRCLGWRASISAPGKIDFTPIGPAPAGMAGIEVTPDKKWAYTVVANGMHREQALRVLGR